MEQNNQADFVLGKGRIIIDNDVVQILSEKDEKEVVQAMDDIKNRLLELSDESYIHIVPPNTAAEHAYLLPKTDKALENYEKRDKTGRPLFGVVIGEADSNRPVFTVERKNIPEGEEPITLEDLAQIERSHIKMKELLAIESIWHFFSYLKNTLGIDEKRLTLIHKAVPEGGWKIRNRSKRHVRKDYLEFLSHIWPDNTELLDAYDAVREEEHEKHKERIAINKAVKEWEALGHTEQMAQIRSDFPKEEWDKVSSIKDWQHIIAKVRELYGITYTPFQQVFLQEAKNIEQKTGKVIPWPANYTYPSPYPDLPWFYYMYHVMWGKTHPKKRFTIVENTA